MVELQKVPKHWIIESLAGERSFYSATRRQTGGRRGYLLYDTNEMRSLGLDQIKKTNMST